MRRFTVSARKGSEENKSLETGVLVPLYDYVNTVFNHSKYVDSEAERFLRGSNNMRRHIPNLVIENCHASNAYIAERKLALPYEESLGGSVAMNVSIANAQRQLNSLNTQPERSARIALVAQRAMENRDKLRALVDNTAEARDDLSKAKPLRQEHVLASKERIRKLHEDALKQLYDGHGQRLTALEEKYAAPILVPNINVQLEK